MANGDFIEAGRASAGAYYTAWKLLDTIAAVNDGQWIDARGYKRMSLEVSGITTATVQVRGSNDPTKPANASHGTQIGSDITTNSIVSIDVPVRWIKARVSAHTAGTINANLQIVSEG